MHNYLLNIHLDSTNVESIYCSNAKFAVELAQKLIKFYAHVEIFQKRRSKREFLLEYTNNED